MLLSVGQEGRVSAGVPASVCAEGLAEPACRLPGQTGRGHPRGAWCSRCPAAPSRGRSRPSLCPHTLQCPPRCSGVGTLPLPWPESVLLGAACAGASRPPSQPLGPAAPASRIPGLPLPLTLAAGVGALPFAVQ